MPAPESQPPTLDIKGDLDPNTSDASHGAMAEGSESDLEIAPEVTQGIGQYALSTEVGEAQAPAGETYSAEDILAAYSHFAPAIAELKNTLDDPDRAPQLTFLGKGEYSAVLLLETEDGRFAVRVPHNKKTQSEVVSEHLAAGILGKGVNHLEQIVAASQEEGVTIAELLPGKELGNLAPEEIAQISDGQLDELLDTLLAVSERNILIDPKPANFLYDSKAGFGLVDYHSPATAPNSSDNQPIDEIVSSVAYVLGEAGFNDTTEVVEPTKEDYAHQLIVMQASLAVLYRYRSVAERKLSGDAMQNALQGIDTTIHTQQAIVQNYGDPEWIAKRVGR